MEKFPNELKGKLIDYYFNEADKMLKAKLISASHRDDDLAFNAQLASIIRSMNICLFAINDTHFPGDKWNFDSIKQFKIKPSGYGATLRTVLDESNDGIQNKLRKYALLEGLLNEISRISSRVMDE